MKLGIVVNVMDSDEAGATTYRLAADAINLGHRGLDREHRKLVL